MAESYFLLAATFIPLLLAPVSLRIGRKAGPKRLGFPLGPSSLYRVIVDPCRSLYSQQTVYVEQYEWGQFGDFGLRLDGLSMPFALIIYILCTVIALYSRPYMVHKVSEDLPGHGNGGEGVGGGNARHNSNRPQFIPSIVCQKP